MRVLVTGCSTGIGRATATELATRGHSVVATARKPATLADLDVADRIALDVDSDDSVAAALAAAGELDALVNNAGFGVGGPVEKVPLAEVRRMFETNFFGAVRMMQAVMPGWRERGSGTIVNVTSVSGVVAAPLSGFYSATKFALEAVTEAARIELGHYGVRVLSVQPGYIETAFGANTTNYGEDEPPYDELAKLWTEAENTLAMTGGNDERQQADMVARVIADAVESNESKRHWPAGTDAEMIVGTRETTPYDQFEAAMRAMLNLDW
jgi:NAD(P)-dependent dehydrogenase (short-subunit alcohol dehydrogenase family)